MHIAEPPAFGSTDPRDILTLVVTNGRCLVSRAGTGSCRRLGQTSEVRKTLTPDLFESGGSELPSCGRLHGRNSWTSILPNFRSSEGSDRRCCLSVADPKCGGLEARLRAYIRARTTELPEFRRQCCRRLQTAEAREYLPASLLPVAVGSTELPRFGGAMVRLPLSRWTGRVGSVHAKRWGRGWNDLLWGGLRALRLRTDAHTQLRGNLTWGSTPSGP